MWFESNVQFSPGRFFIHKRMTQNSTYPSAIDVLVTKQVAIMVRRVLKVSGSNLDYRD
jgi:hypothetical protein